jgi:hypothetical protein
LAPERDGPRRVSHQHVGRRATGSFAKPRIP